MSSLTSKICWSAHFLSRQTLQRDDWYINLRKLALRENRTFSFPLTLCEFCNCQNMNQSHIFVIQCVIQYDMVSKVTEPKDSYTKPKTAMYSWELLVHYCRQRAQQLLPSKTHIEPVSVRKQKQGLHWKCRLREIVLIIWSCKTNVGEYEGHDCL